MYIIINYLNVKNIRLATGFFLTAFLVLNSGLSGQSSHIAVGNRQIEFPDIPGFKTLVCDFHMHTVLSDGHVWPSIRVEEAQRDGLDAISITDHIEYQPHREDIPHPDRNRSYQLALRSAEESDLIVINGAEITRAMPPGHANAIFLEDVNALNREDVWEVFREARQQEAFIFWNHPHWTAQRPDGIATLMDMHGQLITEGLINGIEVVNDMTYSDEALQIALDHNLTIMGTSDIHGLVDWQFGIPEGGHRPVTLVFAGDKTPEAIKEALFQGRTAVWFKNFLVGQSDYIIPLIRKSLTVTPGKKKEVLTVWIKNTSDADYTVENLTDYTFHANADVFTLGAHRTTVLRVKTGEPLNTVDLKFRILNAVTAPGEHPEITWTISPE